MTDKELDELVEELQNSPLDLTEFVLSAIDTEEELRQLKEKVRIQNYLRLQEENNQLKEEIELLKRRCVSNCVQD